MTFTDGPTAKTAAHSASAAGNRRLTATRRLKIRRRIAPTEALHNASTAREVVKAMSRKATEFTEACLLELGVTATLEIPSVIQRALLQDFIEVYNAAVSRTIRLPEEAKEIEALAKK